MKKLVLSVLLAMSLVLVGCSDDDSGGGGGGGGGSNGPQVLDVQISGTFGTAGKFYAAPASATASEAASTLAAADQFTLTGKVTDGAITFNLTGTYNSVAQSYVLSAASSIIVFQITGNIDASGAVQDGKVMVSVNNGSGWTDTEYAAGGVGAAVDIPQPADDSQIAGIPAEWQGIFYDDTEGLYVDLSAFAFVVSSSEGDDQVFSFKEVDCAGSVCVLISYNDGGRGKWTKHRLSGAGTQLTYEYYINPDLINEYYRSDFDTRDAAVAATITADDDVATWNRW